MRPGIALDINVAPRHGVIIELVQCCEILLRESATVFSARQRQNAHGEKRDALTFLRPPSLPPSHPRAVPKSSVIIGQVSMRRVIEERRVLASHRGFYRGTS